jgi:catechol 2,3-dioxygenase
VADSLPPETTVGRVGLTVADLGTTRDFYERAIGLRTIDGSGGRIRLGVDDRTLVELVSDPGATPRPRATTGLFHLAILVPDRAELAAALRRVAGNGWRFTGASDHLVSEALYLNDPEGNGIEIYRDRPRAQWREVDGELQMDTLPLDLQSLLAEGNGSDAPDPEMAPGTRMGHVHLNVADLGEAERFYAGLLGLDVTVRGYPGALFVSAGGYHHHLGLNTWAGEGAPPPPPGSRGLRSYELLLPGSDDVRSLADRAADAGAQVDEQPEGVRVTDPSGNRVVLADASR